MKMGRWAGGLLLAIAPFVTGCTGFWNAPTSSTTTTTTTTLSSGYFFLLDTGTSNIVSYSILSGVLTLGKAYSLPSAPIAMTVAPNGNFLYVSTASGIYVYTISSGVLTLSNSSSDISADPATAMQVDPSGTWLVESSGSGLLSAIPIASATGLLDSLRTTQNVTLASTSVNQMVFPASGGYLFIALGSNGTQEFAFKSSASAPLGTSPANTISLKGTSALSVAVDPSSRMVYIGETAATTGSNSGGLRAFVFSPTANTLSELGASPISSGGTGPYSILPISSGDYVYVANWTGQSSSGNITGFQIAASGASYTLTNVNSIATGIRPMAIAEDSNGHFILAANSGGSPYLDAYIFDTTTAGKLDLTLSSSTYEASGVSAVQ